MKAVVLTDYGDVDKLELRDVPDPKPGPGEVKIRTAATSVNAIDWKIRSGAARQMMPLQFPAILGRDVSGERARARRHRRNGEAIGRQAPCRRHYC